MNRNKHLILILIAMIGSFVISNTLSKNVFIANTPRIRSNLNQYLAQKIKSTFSDNYGRLLSLIRRRETNTETNPPTKNTTSNPNTATNTNSTTYTRKPSTPLSFESEIVQNALKPITKGVSAATIDNTVYYEYKVKEIEWVRIDYTTKNGRQLKLSFPKGTNIPSRNILEKMYD